MPTTIKTSTNNYSVTESLLEVKRRLQSSLPSADSKDDYKKFTRHDGVTLYIKASSVECFFDLDEQK